MEEPFGGAEGGTKQHKSAEAVNRALCELALSCRRGAEIVPKCDVGVIGYGGDGPTSAFAGKLKSRDLVSVAELAAAPLRESSGNEIPEWVMPVADGGTPMAEAFQLAQVWVGRWAGTHRGSFPPIVINVTDGEPHNAMAAEQEAAAVRRVETDEGAALLLNVHISGTRGTPIILPSHEDPNWDDFAQLLFRMSSVLPDRMLKMAEKHGFTATANARGYVYNANGETLVKTLLFGSDPGKWGGR